MSSEHRHEIMYGAAFEECVPYVSLLLLLLSLSDSLESIKIAVFCSTYYYFDSDEIVETNSFECVYAYFIRGKRRYIQQRIQAKEKTN